MAITDWPVNERPRERLLNLGPQTLSDAELLAIFLRVGMKGKTALDLARELIQHFGGLKPLLLANCESFCEVPGMGPAKYVQLQASLEMSKRYFLEEVREGDAITSSDACRQYVLRHLADQEREIFACLLLDTQHKIISFEELFMGTLDSASVHPREVVKLVLEKNSAAVILCHNHPSGSNTISQADKHITKLLIQALDLIDVKVLDHFIIAGNQVVSFAERSLI